MLWILTNCSGGPISRSILGCPICGVYSVVKMHGSCILSCLDYVLVLLCPGCGLMIIAGRYAGRFACFPVGTGCCVAC